MVFLSALVALWQSKLAADTTQGDGPQQGTENYVQFHLFFLHAGGVPD
uniref:Uncharacterized protein n=1 Tax=Salmonella enterica subsp. salamae TaxID=59202 RepID=I3W421_SALER|nr:hypothetical protein [Salmonella enterica]AFK90348.1 hypothetical protein [Salmonella enterica subsp. salamae]